MNSIMDSWIAALRSHGAKEVDKYERELQSFGGNDQKVFEMLSEARAALLFLRNGWQVTMRDKPDLYTEFNGEPLYMEVKHYNQKETDRRDGRAMATARPFEFVQVGNVINDENGHGWQQMYSNAVKKVPQYMDGFPNILLFVSYSESMDLLLESAVNEYADQIRKPHSDPALRKLSGMMMIGNTYGPSTANSNVHLCPIYHAHKPITRALAEGILTSTWGEPALY